MPSRVSFRLNGTSETARNRLVSSHPPLGVRHETGRGETYAWNAKAGTTATASTKKLMPYNKRTPVRIALHGHSREGVVGVAASPPALPEPVMRWPGEPLEALAQRAARACIGASGLVLLKLLYAEGPAGSTVARVGVGVGGVNGSYPALRWASHSSLTCRPFRLLPKGVIR